MFALFAANSALAQTSAGSITTLTGDVHVERAGSTTPATPGMALLVGDRIVTGPNSRATITLIDKSNLELDQSTALVIDQAMLTANSRSTKLSLFTGLVRSFVSYTSAPTPNFEVHTPNAVASARGTEYDTVYSNTPPADYKVETKKKKYRDCRRFTEVRVYDGTVEVSNSTNPSGGSVQVKAGHKTLVACGYAPLPESAIGAAAAAAAAATGGTIGSTTTGLLLGSGLVLGGAGAGLGIGLSGGGGSSGNKHPKSPNQ